jgi:surface antigen
MRIFLSLSCLATASLLAACSPLDSRAPGGTANMQDKDTHEHTAQSAMETGHVLSWKNGSTDNYGTIVPHKLYRSRNGSYCRDFTQTTTVDDMRHTGTGTACRGDNGRWIIIG